MIELENVTKIYNSGRPNEFQALKEITLSLEQQKVSVFKGPSGSGKTTLLSIIGCMSRPTMGRIRLNGREITSLPERFAAQIRRKTFGFVFQNYNLIKGLTVLENVMIPAYPEGTRHAEIENRAVDLLAGLDMEAKARQRVEHLSGGEQQRVAVARALINDPQCIIADEPTAHLDTALAETLLDILLKLKRDGRTVLVASHDPLVFQSEVVDRVVDMRDGRLMPELPAP